MPIKFLIFIVAIMLSGKIFSQQAAQIFSNNMVLQRDMEVPVWGTSIPGETVNVTFDGASISTTTSPNGDWLAKLPKHPAGGPYELKIEGKTSTTFSNVLVGDVWIAGGQSNMQFTTNNVINAEEELKNANFPEIRLLSIYTEISEKPRETFNGTKWEVCTPKTAEWFSAVGFLFARNVHQKYHIPIGIISSNCGGTNVETWTSMESMMAFDNYKAAIEKVRKIDLAKTVAEQAKKLEAWKTEVILNDPGIKGSWYNTKTNYNEWTTCTLPERWDDKLHPELDGTVWYQREFELTEHETTNSITLHLSKIDDGDVTYVNGKVVGETTQNHNLPRKYIVDSKLLKPGKNILVVKVVDYGGGGGFWGSPSEMMIATNSRRIPLPGTWKYHLGANSPTPQMSIGANSYPGLLFNAMIAPVVGYGIKGVIWYQGEANVHNAPEYIDHFPALIADWRKQWNQGDFPFLYVQLANFNARGTADDGDWATIRETQLKTLSMVKNTGMAVTIDIGTSNDIHPKNKQDVAKRLFLASQHVAYNDQLVYSGPVYKSMAIADGKISISFDHAVNGLKLKGKKTTGIEIAGVDKKFVKAEAKIDADKLLVWSANIASPVAVRYGWAQDPFCNIYNSEDLPASPFRTDNW